MAPQGSGGMLATQVAQERRGRAGRVRRHSLRFAVVQRKSGIVVACIVLVGGGLLGRGLVVGRFTVEYWSERPEQVALVVVMILAALITAVVVRRRHTLAERKRRFATATRDGASTLSADRGAAWTSGVDARRALSKPGAGVPTPPDVPEAGLMPPPSTSAPIEPSSDQLLPPPSP